MSISVNKVSKLYGEQLALDQVSFEIKQGEIIGFLGPNGAGKSTMMKIITGYIPASSGEVSVCGLDVATNDIEIKSKIGYLPEHNPLYLDMYVKEYLTYCARIYKLKNVKERVEEMIELTGLTVEQSKKLGQLSKGYRQRVGIAQALIHDPDVLILDEPTTGLDPNQLVDIRALIKKIGESKTVMLSTHIMQEVEAICDRVIIVNKGNIVADKNISDTKQESGSLKIEFNEPIDVSEFKAVFGVEIQALGGNKYFIKEIKKDIKQLEKDIFKWAVEKDMVIRQFSVDDKSLEDFFKAITKN